jgi:hypothetical protein
MLLLCLLHDGPACFKLAWHMAAVCVRHSYAALAPTKADGLVCAVFCYLLTAYACCCPVYVLMFCLQVINAAGHAAPVDWWSFGILLYELMFGTTPFR